MANSTADGSVVIDVNMDVSDAEKELARLKNRVFKLENDIGEKSAQKSNLEKRINEKLSEYKKFMEKYSETDDHGTFLRPKYGEQATELYSEYKKIQAEIKKIDESIDKSNVSLEFTKQRYGEITQLASQLKEEEASRAETLEKEKALEKAFDNAESTIAEQEAQQRILDIKEKSAVADQKIVDLQEELTRLAQRRKELESAGVGLGYEEYDGILSRTNKINQEIKEYQNGLIAANKAEQNVADSAEKMAQAHKKADKHIRNFANRLKEIVLSALIFNVLSSGLRQFTLWLGKAVNSNEQARAAIAKLKGALLTLAQPLIEVIIPAFTALVNVLARVISVIAQFVSMLFGKTLKQSADGAKNLYEEADAIGAVGSAADKAAGSLAGFDEINTISTDSPQGGGGGGEANLAPDFSWLDEGGGLFDRLKEIADLVALIAAGFALWKIGSVLPGVLGNIMTKLGGILLTVGGLLLLWHGLTDAWENGVDWLNLIEMIGGLAAAAFGLCTLFGPMAAGIALVVGGIAMLVTAFHDAMENGWNLQNTLLAISGILAAGLGISMITGSWIPLLIAGIAAAALALAVATGHGEELIAGIQLILEGFLDFFGGIFSGDMEQAANGITKIFEGLKTSIGAIFDGMRDGFIIFLDWLDEKTEGRFHGIIEAAKEFISNFSETAKLIMSGLIESIIQIFTGFIEFLVGVFTLDWDLAWEGVKNIFKGAWNHMITLLEGAVNLIITGLNWMIAQLNKIQFSAPDWVPVIGGRSFGFNIPSISTMEIPRLARGAVIPPNREFMAVLGDQRKGYNLEAPEGLIRKIVREESGGANTALLEAILAAIKEGKVIMVDRRVLGQVVTQEQNRMTRSSGRSVVLG